MSKFFLGFIVCLGMVMGCGAADNTAVSPKPAKEEARLIKTGSSDFDGFGSKVIVFKDKDTGQEYIYSRSYEGGVFMLKVEDSE